MSHHSAPDPRLAELSKLGVAVWLDDVSRQRLSSGNLAELIAEDSVVGVTSNPTIFAAALADAGEYRSQLDDLAERDVDVDEAVRSITGYDIRWAADVLRPVYDRTNGVDGRVSLEVDPRLAHRTEATLAEARALWWSVDRPNLFIKIPATLEGLPAITEAIAEGISVNVTLIFGLERYRAVMDAYLAGLERAFEAGHDLADISSVASFFVSRFDSEVDKRLDAIGTPEATGMKGAAAIANARLAFEAYEAVFNDDNHRWAKLRHAGAHVQRPLWASTSTKDPNLPDTLYVTELVTAGTVNTMPENTLRATADHGEFSGDTVRDRYEEARKTIASLEALGIAYDDVVGVLEAEGVEKFVKSWNELLETVSGELAKAQGSGR